MHEKPNSAIYYRDRERAERKRADEAVSDHVRQIHLTLAERYLELAEKAETSTT